MQNTAFFIENLVYGEWSANADIKSGLYTAYGSKYYPCTFYIGTDLYLIVQNAGTGDFYGYKWNGSTWSADTDIVDGLTTVTGSSPPTVFYIGANLYLIRGYGSGVFYGHSWNGSTWSADTDIVDGLPDIGSSSSPHCFYIGTDLYLISGSYWGTFYGYKWNGSTWVADTDIKSGLSSVFSTAAETKCDTIEIAHRTYLIEVVGTNPGSTIKGYTRNGNTWVRHDIIIAGLSSIGDVFAPTMFYIGSTMYMVGGYISGYTGWEWG